MARVPNSHIDQTNHLLLRSWAKGVGFCEECVKLFGEKASMFQQLFSMIWAIHLIREELRFKTKFPVQLGLACFLYICSAKRTTSATIEVGFSLALNVLCASTGCRQSSHVMPCLPKVALQITKLCRLNLD